LRPDATPLGLEARNASAPPRLRPCAICIRSPRIRRPFPGCSG
jgi:hypothetical protein